MFICVKGSFATASCTVCGHKMTSDGIRTDVFAQKIPLCPVCPPGSGKKLSLCI